MSRCIFNPKSEFQEFHLNNRDDYMFEIKQKRPSEFFLDNFAKVILKCAEKWQSMEEISIPEVTSLENEIDIFLADLPSDLSINNDKEYRQKWKEKYSKLKQIQSNLEKAYSEQSNG